MRSSSGRSWLRRAAGVAVLAGLVGGFAGLVLSADKPVSTKSSRSSAAASGSSPNIEQKLSEISDKQDEILSKFDAVMEELRIIKIRTTLRTGGS